MATTQKIPAVQLPVGAVPNPQSGASKDTLKKMKESVMTPALPTGSKLTPQLQQAKTPEILTTGGVSTTAPTAATPTGTTTEKTNPKNDLCFGALPNYYPSYCGP